MSEKKPTGESTPKNEVKKTGNTTAPVKTKAVEKPSYQDLQKRVSELEKKQDAKPKDIQSVIDFFEEKKKKITHLDLFKRIKERLNDAYAEIKPLSDNQEFEKQAFVLTFAVYSSYSKGEEIFKITNPLVIEKCIDFLKIEIDQKTKMLETEIQQDF